MKSRRKYLLILLCLICVHVLKAQNSKTDTLNDGNTEFLLSISTFNHADDTWFGIKTYSLKNNILTISERDSTLFTQSIDDNSMNSIRNINLNDLAAYYDNECVFVTSGNEYFVTTMNNGGKRTITLHHYYLKEIEMLINELNKQIPEELKIDYLESDTKQDCK